MTDVRGDVLEIDDFDTILSADIEFAGRFSIEKSFLIRGKVSGEVNASGLLVIDEGAVVEANIKAEKVIIFGSVKGNVTASEKVEVAATGRLTGNVSAPDIHMETGHYFSGRSIMPEPKNAANSPRDADPAG
jgi:cytoskeletal protein CcmA (bactofilin family)